MYKLSTYLSDWTSVAHEKHCFLCAIPYHCTVGRRDCIHQRSRWISSISFSWECLRSLAFLPNPKKKTKLNHKLMCGGARDKWREGRKAEFFTQSQAQSEWVFRLLLKTPVIACDTNVSIGIFLGWSFVGPPPTIPTKTKTRNSTLFPSHYHSPLPLHSSPSPPLPSLVPHQISRWLKGGSRLMGCDD